MPPTYSEGNVTVMPIVFPDGTSAELIYPPEMDLAGLGVSASTGGWLRGDKDDYGRITLSYGFDAAGDRPLTCLHGQDGLVEVWGSSQEGVAQFLRWRVRRWDVVLSDLIERDRPEDLHDWALAVAARVLINDWVVLEPSPEVRLGAQAHGEMEIQIGNVGDIGILLHPLRCNAEPGAEFDEMINGRWVSVSRGFGHFCDADAPMDVHIYAPAEFSRSLAANLQIRNVRHEYPVDRYGIVP